MYDDKGLSSMVVHSEKGKTLFDTVMHQLSFKETLIDDVKLYNSDYIRSNAFVHSRRKAFWKDYHQHKKPFEKLLKKHLEDSKTKILFKYIKKVVRRCLLLLKGCPIDS